MSIADHAKLAYTAPAGDQNELLARLVNEIFRSPAAGLGVQPNLAGPSLGGAGVSPGAFTTGSPLPLDPSPVKSGVPSGVTPDIGALNVVHAGQPQLSFGGPSLGGAGLSPGSVTTALPLKLEPSAAKTVIPSSPTIGLPETGSLDQLVDAALSGSVYSGPSLAGIGVSPGIATTSIPNGGAAVPQSSPFGGATVPSLDPLGLDIPGLHGVNGLGATSTPASAPRPETSSAPVPAYHFYSEPNPAAAKPPANHTGVSSAASGQPRDPKFSGAYPPFDINAIRRDFPILSEKVNGRPLIWLDNAATTQKPKSVIDRLTYFYEHENSNIHRAAHELAARATDAYEDAREAVRRFLNAPTTEGVIFTRGTTEAINLVAASWGRQHIGPGDEIIVSNLEHHANIVPWQLLAWEKGAKIRVAPVDDHGQILLDQYQRLFNSRTKIVSFTQVSNALGTVTPAKAMIEIARHHNVKVLLDGAQSVSHMRVDLQELDPDFFVFSGHKVFGPTGIGALYGKPEILNLMQPYQGGGNMIQDVTFERTIFHPAPNRFEAGTGNIADAAGLAAAIEYVERIGMDNISRYEHSLLEYATHRLHEVPGLTIIGTAPDKASVISLAIDGHTSEDIGAALNAEGIAVRSGHHCAQPILRRFGYETTVRPSLAFYNTCGEVDCLVDVLKRIAAKGK